MASLSDAAKIPAPPGFVTDTDSDREAAASAQQSVNPVTTAGGNPTLFEDEATALRQERQTTQGDVSQAPSGDKPASTAGGNLEQSEKEGDVRRNEIQALRDDMSRVMKMLEDQQKVMVEQAKTHQESLKKMETTLTEERLQAKINQLELQMEVNKLKGASKSNKEEEQEEKGEKIMKLRGFDFKSVPKPDKFDLKPEKFNA